MGLSTLTTLFCHLISYLCFPLAEISHKARKSGWWKPQLSTSWGVSRVEKNEEYMKQWLNIDTVILFCILPINVYVCVRNHAQLFATPLCNCNSPGSSVLGIFQAKILKWVAISYSRGSFQPRNQTHLSWVSCLGRRILYHHATQQAQIDMIIINNIFLIN